MKRILLGLLAALLMSAGLATIPTSPATAACPYTNCVTTATNSRGVTNITTQRQARIFVGVRVAGNVGPQGTVTLRVLKAGRAVFTKTQAVRREQGSGVSRTTFLLRKFAAGKYRITVAFKPARGSVYKASTGKPRVLNVRKPRRV